MCSPSASTKPSLKSRANKRRRSTRTRRIITSLHSKLLIGILSHVASNSVNDLFNARATCKLMSKSGSEHHVLQNASVLDKFCHRGCREQSEANYSCFMAECVGNDN
ncbi:hypothetical protein LINPERHAP1_LOCUS25164 [Linum perenne]